MGDIGFKVCLQQVNNEIHHSMNPCSGPSLVDAADPVEFPVRWSYTQIFHIKGNATAEICRPGWG